MASTDVAVARVVKTACSICPQACGMNVHIENGRVVRVSGIADHPVNRGRLCPKGAVIADIACAPDRLRHPMKKVNGDWQQVSWDEALDIIAEKLTDIKEKSGARSFIYHMGEMRNGAIATARRFCDVYGTPNVISSDSMCIRTRGTVHRLTFGRGRFYDPKNARCVLVWGNNPDNSGFPQADYIDDARKNGAKLIVIDPRRTSIARRADILAQPRPGTDCALGLGILGVVIEERLYDSEFVAKWTTGFDKLVEHLKNYPLTEIERITWVPAETIRQIARMFATNGPATVVQGGNSLDQCTSGTQTNRVIAILEAITANVDVPGGLVKPGTVPLSPMRLPERLKEYPLGAEKYPFSYQVAGYVIGEGQAMVVPDVILSGQPYPIKAMFITGANLAITWPDATKMATALRALDFLVVMDLFMTETARMAHLVLPAATFLEADEIPTLPMLPRSRRWLMVQKKVVDLPECWPDIKFWLKLAHRMGYHTDFPWQNEQEVLDYMLKPTGLTLRELQEEKTGGVEFGFDRYRAYEKDGFPTPSGKVEIYSETMAKAGYGPLPAYVESPEGPLSNPEMFKEYPVILTTGGRYKEFLHSGHRNIARLRRIDPEPFAELHPQTAAKYGIAGDDVMVIENKRGRIEMKARLTEDIIPGVLHVPHGWPQANADVLTDGTPSDPVTGFPVLKQLLCRISKKA
ncbi:MAG: molybdopterin-dependent oxidoreductase [Chloroflexi bacterium]|nr:molybdopterin-dependent oxidoreductase [Chloroflexota bacterium]